MDPGPALDVDSFLRFNATAIAQYSGKVARAFIRLPSRVLARLRKLDDLAFDLHDVAQTTQRQQDRGDGGGAQAYRCKRSGGGSAGAPPIPGPWGFLTSGYFVGLFVVAFLLNRIQNIVVPPRRPLVLRLRHNQERQYHPERSWYGTMLGFFFPVDFSSTFSRAMLRLPSLYFLGNAAAVWLAFLVQALDPSVYTRSQWLQPLGTWAARLTLEDACWHTFLSACFALCIGALTTGLEGLNINDNAPFNLFAFAFQLYVESASHDAPADGEPLRRPNAHVALTVLFPLLHLTAMHTLEIKPRWARYRLAITTLSGVASLAHFHYVVWCSPAAYPLTTYAARVVESLMGAVITLTVALNAVTQLLTEGSLTRPLFAHASLMPRADEDFIVGLFRLGTASMEATAVAGLGNEVGAVASTHPSSPSPPPPPGSLVHGALDIDRAGVSGMTAAYEPRAGGRRTVRRGFANEIARVRAKAAGTDMWRDTVLSAAWQRHFVAFLASAWRAARRVLAAALSRASRLRGESDGEVVPERREKARSPSVEVSSEPTMPMPMREWDSAESEEAYARFLRGETISDDEDDFVPDDMAIPPPDGTSSDSDCEADDLPDRPNEHANLYTDLSTSASDPLLFARMANTSPAPLTRMGYRRLVTAPAPTSTPAPDAADAWDELAFVDERRREKRHAMSAAAREEAANPRTCVICTVEPRDIICWPCRCLALCDDYRNNLAARSAASKHTCPCCRRSVEGYSKIYIP